MNVPLEDFLAAYNRTQRWKCAYVAGTFDTLHRGHLALIATAKQIAEQVVVSVNTDAFAARYKRHPLMPLADRMAVLGALRDVDRVVVNTGDEDSGIAIVHARQTGLPVDVIVHGSDWTAENGLLKQMGLTAYWLEAHGIDLVTPPYTEWTSTTDLLAAYDCRKAHDEAKDDY